MRCGLRECRSDRLAGGLALGNDDKYLWIPSALRFSFEACQRHLDRRTTLARRRTEPVTRTLRRISCREILPKHRKSIVHVSRACGVGSFPPSPRKRGMKSLRLLRGSQPGPQDKLWTLQLLSSSERMATAKKRTKGERERVVLDRFLRTRFGARRQNPAPLLRKEM